MKKILSILMCCLLFANTSGVAYAQHFCGDFQMMATLTLGKEKLSCGMASVQDDCTDESSETHTCCDNQYTDVITDDNFNIATNDTLEPPINFVAAFVSIFVISSEIRTEKNVSTFSEYNPPPLIKDIPVLYETFLI